MDFNHPPNFTAYSHILKVVDERTFVLCNLYYKELGKHRHIHKSESRYTTYQWYIFLNL
ncbi:17708_t:CDS:2 [Gigaspora margarita]|uniref:17708_t:CDS:1 n=1 Tax=Gigaspora margarita TaxID=4874 RepID=A0ABN7V5G9_GIGMA|nr:17708_t:CDS:2 [Gigaspora margarita]